MDPKLSLENVMSNVQPKRNSEMYNDWVSAGGFKVDVTLPDGTPAKVLRLYRGKDGWRAQCETSEGKRVQPYAKELTLSLADTPESRGVAAV